MVKVITYGTYDLLHFGHIRLLERAKELGDYLIVGVTADDFDKTRGKINVEQSLIERIEAVKATGIADEIIIEEYEGQKIDDIKKYDIDIFTVGSDWVGKFDYLNEYCKVVYLDRTQGVSSSELRSKERSIKLGLIGETNNLRKYFNECTYVNGVHVAYVCSQDPSIQEECKSKNIIITDDYDEVLNNVEAVYITSHPTKHYIHTKQALEKGVHVFCESPVTLNAEQCKELFQIAESKNLILMESIKTAYSTAYNRLLLLVKGGKIGKVVSVDATCTSIRNIGGSRFDLEWNSICAWGPSAMLPIFQILGVNYDEIHMSSMLLDDAKKFDLFTKADFKYHNAVASFKVAVGAKSEGSLLISGTQGYIYVPAPWWKTDYFEIRYENQDENKRYFYQLDGEGIRYGIVAFVKSIETGKINSYIDEEVTEKIAEVTEIFESGNYSIIGE